MIEQAASRIREMLSHAKQELSGVELKVHENILDKCTDLMNYILQLIKQSDQLQREIVEAGRVSVFERGTKLTSSIFVNCCQN